MVSVMEQPTLSKRKSYCKEWQQKTEARLPRPVVFFSDFEKDAYRRNRSEDCKLQNKLQNLQRAQTVCEKSMKFQSTKFKIDKAHLLKAQQKSKENNKSPSLNQLVLVDRVRHIESPRNRKTGVFIHCTDYESHPLTRLDFPLETKEKPIITRLELPTEKKDSTRVPGSSSSQSSDDVPTKPSQRIIRPQTTRLPNKKKIPKRCKSADPNVRNLEGQNKIANKFGVTHSQNSKRRIRFSEVDESVPQAWSPCKNAIVTLKDTRYNKSISRKSPRIEK